MAQLKTTKVEGSLHVTEPIGTNSHIYINGIYKQGYKVGDSSNGHTIPIHCNLKLDSDCSITSDNNLYINKVTIDKEGNTVPPSLYGLKYISSPTTWGTVPPGWSQRVEFQGPNDGGIKLIESPKQSGNAEFNLLIDGSVYVKEGQKKVLDEGLLGGNTTYDKYNLELSNDGILCTGLTFGAGDAQGRYSVNGTSYDVNGLQETSSPKFKSLTLNAGNADGLILNNGNAIFTCPDKSDNLVEFARIGWIGDSIGWGIKCQHRIEANMFNATSDARLKENFQPLKIEKSILDLPTYKFDFIDGAKNQIGCKAQDLQEICPEIVDEGNDGYLSIQESKIVYLLLEEVKKLRKEVNELRER